MADFPSTLEEAIAQARSATQAAIAAGYSRISVELMLPELKPMDPAREFLPALEAFGSDLKVFFTDAGSAALARRDWGPVPFRIGSLDVAGSRQTSTVDELVSPDDRAFLVVAPSAVEIGPVEQVCQAAGDRPTVLFNPRLEDISIVGIGYAARQLRDRFLNTIEPAYQLRPLEGAAILRRYPDPWQVWLEGEEGYRLIAEELVKPDPERLDQILIPAMNPDSGGQRSLLGQLGQFLRALSQ